MKLFANLINIKSSKIGQYPGDTEGDSIILTSEGSAGKGETQQQYGMAGFISNPAKNVKGVRFRIGSLDIVIGALNYKVALPENPGETKVYSTDVEGDEKSAIKLKPDGTIEINGNADNAVSYQDLKDALDSFKTSIDSAISGAISSAIAGHTHVYSPGPSPPVPTASGVGAGNVPPISLDISSSKVEEVKLP